MVLFMCLLSGFVYTCSDLIVPSLPLDHTQSTVVNSIYTHRNLTVFISILFAVAKHLERCDPKQRFIVAYDFRACSPSRWKAGR